jgi:hypothetical protein
MQPKYETTEGVSTELAAELEAWLLVQPPGQAGELLLLLLPSSAPAMPAGGATPQVRGSNGDAAEKEFLAGRDGCKESLALPLSCPGDCCHSWREWLLQQINFHMALAFVSHRMIDFSCIILTLCKRSRDEQQHATNDTLVDERKLKCVGTLPAHSREVQHGRVLITCKNGRGPAHGATKL